MTRITGRCVVRAGWGIAFVLAMALPAAAAVTPQQVEEALKKGVANLYSRQRDGTWEKSPAPDEKNEGPSVTGRQWGGRTAIATYALLAAGESPQDSRIRQAVQFLMEAPIEGTYALGMRAQVWGFLPPSPHIGDCLRRDTGMLLDLMKPFGEARGLYSYYRDGGYEESQDGNTQGGRYDHSCSNYGVLGVWACAQTGMEIPIGYWRTVDEAWRNHQLPDGGWAYINGGEKEHGEPKLSMTSAAVATLFITQEYLYPMPGPNGPGYFIDEHIERGMRWMGEQFQTFDKHWPYYTLYNIERVGVASGHKYFGSIDWYQRGIEYLVSKQGGDGSWGDVPDTCWAILFLVRGRAPVMMNKLEYVNEARGTARPMPSSWNQRPRDVANITRWFAKQIERDLNWQIVNLTVNADDLHDAPILYIAGKDMLNFSAADEAKLKLFVEQGGLILGNADGNNQAFANSFKRLGSKLFGGEFRTLPDSHPIYTNQQYRKTNWRSRNYLQGLSNGARELMLLLATDPARNWQTGALMGPEREPLWQIAGNIFLYAVDKQNLMYKGETHIVRPNDTKAERTIPVARLQYAGNWDPEPGGWRRLAAVLHNRHKTDLAVQTVKLGEGKLNSSFAVAHLTGTTKFSLTSAARDEIRKFVQGGGTLVLDAAGGAAEFTLSAESELKQIFPDSALPAVLPASHAVYSALDKIEEVEYRTFARKAGLANLRAPRVRGLEVKGRTAVFLSGEDLSVGLVGQPVDGINGYAPAASTVAEGRTRAGASEIMGNLLSYAAKKR